MKLNSKAARPGASAAAAGEIDLEAQPSIAHLVVINPDPRDSPVLAVNHEKAAKGKLAVNHEKAAEDEGSEVGERSREGVLGRCGAGGGAVRSFIWIILECGLIFLIFMLAIGIDVGIYN